MIFLIIIGFFHFCSSADCQIFCDGEILHTVQTMEIFQDSKTFVDMPMKFSPETILSNFQKIEVKDKFHIAQFVNDNFAPAGSDLVDWKPPDWQRYPQFLNKIKNSEYKQFGNQLNELWYLLGKDIDPAVKQNPERHSLLPIPNPFIVPGGRFREFYYWDSYWIIRGLLVCEMHETARNIIENSLYFLDKYGIVPNGARRYYFNRSQPPLLSQMIRDYYSETGNLELLRRAVPLLDKEYSFWMNNRVVVVRKDHNAYELNAYMASTTIPRPESYYVDYYDSKNMSNSEKESFYSDIISACESGMDFSSRWLKTLDLVSIHTRTIVPVDLNAILYRMEENLALFHTLLNTAPPVDYNKAKLRRQIAMDAVLWNESSSQWFDFDLKTNNQTHKVQATNFVPLWSQAHSPFSDTQKQNVVNALQKSGLMQPGGLMTSLINTGQQWDEPNAWSPLVWFTVEGLRNLNTTASLNISQKMGLDWLSSNLIGWTKDHDMHEKYNAYVPGERGAGGEYLPETGFGWTNGVALDFLNQYSEFLV